MRVFVTGGTGLLGNTILRQLNETGTQTIALVRGQAGGREFEGIKTEFAVGDLSDHSVIDQAVASCDAVIHSAGLIHIGWKRLDESMHVNRDGTRTIAEACLKHDRKLVHIGTVDSLAIGTKQDPSNEDTSLDHAGGQVPSNYVLSKRAGVEEVLRLVDQGLQAVITHPGFMLGPWDWKPSSGRMMLEVGRGWKPITPWGGCSVCDSRDVAKATITAMRSDIKSGRQFILAGHNVRYKELWAQMAEVMGTHGPLMRLGPAQQWVTGLVGDLWSSVANEGDLNSAAIRMSSMYHYHDSSRAQRELNYQIRPMAESLRDCAAWIREHHLN